MSSSHCSSLITNWSLSSDGSGDYTGTSASTTFICFNSTSVFYVNGGKVGYFNPNINNQTDISSVLGGSPSEIANTNDKVWVYTGGTNLIEFNLELSPIEYFGGGEFPNLTYNRNLTSSGVTAFNGLGALDNTRLVGGSGSTIYLHTITGSGFTSELLFVLPESRTINDVSYNSLKNTFIVASMKADKTVNYISEFTTGGTIVNNFSFNNSTYSEILSAFEYSGKTYFTSLDSSPASTTYEVEVDVFNSGFTQDYDFGGVGFSGFSQSPGSITSFFNYSAASYCLLTNYSATSQYDGNYTSGGTFNGQTFYAGNNGGVIYYNTGSTSWCLSTSLGGSCIIFGGNSCQSATPNFSSGFFSNSICPTPTPSPTSDCSILDIEAFFDCDIIEPTPSATPTMTPTVSSGYIPPTPSVTPTMTPTVSAGYIAPTPTPTPTPTMTSSPTASPQLCNNVNFCFNVQDVSPTPTPTPTMTPSSAAGRNTSASGTVSFTTINDNLICPPPQIV